MTMESALGEIILGDGIEGLFSLPKGEAALVLTDLPSGETRAEFDVKPNLRLFWHAVWHALKPSGICVCLASSLDFASELLRSTPFYRYDLIWSKSASSGFLNAHHRPLRSHEFVLVFFREPGTYEPQMSEGHPPINACQHQSLSENYGAMSGESHSRAGATDRFPRSVLEFASVGTSSKERVHPQQKPEPLLEHLISSYSLPGELVVDPYSGSGSTGRAALRAKRRFTGWDTSPRFAPRVLTSPIL